MRARGVGRGAVRGGLRHSLTLRLGLIYVALFLTSTVALFGAAYWIGVYQPLLEAAAGVSVEAAELVAIDRGGGRDALVRALRVRE